MDQRNDESMTAMQKIQENEKINQAPEMEPLDTQQQSDSPPPEPQQHTFLFSGQASEYFRIWIANLFLSIATLGIYAAWAKVRTRRYFYAHTKLSGHVFDYLASPGAILKGNLIIGGGLLLYNLGTHFSPVLSISVMVLFGLIFPFLVYKSLRFFSHNSSFRNIRFRFLGTLKASYITYLFYPLIMPLTLGLAMPYWAFQRKRYFFDNLAFGATMNSFKARPSYFYRVYGLSLLMFIGVGALAAAISGGMVAGLFATGANSLAAAGPLDKTLLLTSMLATYAIMLVSMTVIQQYVYARITNYCWSQSELGPLSFDCTLKARKLIGISLVNLVAIVISLGLMIPWAKVRRTRYILDNLTVHSGGDLNHFHAATVVEENAIGDAAADYFDFDIAL